MKQLAAYFSIFIVLSLISCEGDQTVKYRFTGLDLVPVTSAAGLPSPAASDSIPSKLFGIRLLLYPEETYRKGRYFDQYESQVINENRITRIEIRCNKTFNGNAPGNIIDGYFMYVPDNYLYAKPLEENSFAPTERYSPEYPDKNFPDHADLLLKTEPLPGDYKFYVRLSFESGGYYSDSTSVIHLY